MKTKKTRHVPVVLPQHLKEEQEILDFLNSDRSGKVETILRNAGFFEEQWIRFPFNELYHCSLPVGYKSYPRIEMSLHLIYCECRNMEKCTMLVPSVQ